MSSSHLEGEERFLSGFKSTGLAIGKAAVRVYTAVQVLVDRYSGPNGSEEVCHDERPGLERFDCAGWNGSGRDCAHSASVQIPVGLMLAIF
jgi:hypothetical protein